MCVGVHVCFSRILFLLCFYKINFFLGWKYICLADIYLFVCGGGSLCCMLTAMPAHVQAKSERYKKSRSQRARGCTSFFAKPLQIHNWWTNQHRGGTLSCILFLGYFFLWSFFILSHYCIFFVLLRAVNFCVHFSFRCEIRAVRSKSDRFTCLFWRAQVVCTFYSP